MNMARKDKPDRSVAQQERDRREISRLYLQGMYQADIAEKLRLSQPTVSRDIQILIEEWKVQRVYDINEAKARELAKVDNLELEYWEAWHRSQQNAEKEIKKAKGIKGGTANQEIQKISEGQTGDPRFLSGIQWCIDRRCLILGVDAPKKVAPTDPSGNKPYGGSDMPVEQIAQRTAQLLEIAKQRKEKDAS
jgi:predicted transcriptional regulator